MKNRIVIVIWLSLFALTGLASQVHVQIESQKIVAGKPFTVTFRINDPSQNFTPDFSKLEKEFNILSTATSTRITIINGQRLSEVVWSITLQTYKAGSITIPSVNFGPLSSKETPITVEKGANIVKQPINPDQQHASVFLKAEVNNKKPYINEAVIYTVKLYRQRGVFINGSYQQQEVNNALVVPLQKSQNSTLLSDGRAFLVESMSYAIYPNDKGELIIKPPSIKGTISDIYMRHFDIDANEVRLDVQPIPKSAQDYWLPASQVSLSQEFSQDLTHLTQGDTVIRTVILSANGLPAQLIPEIKLPLVNHTKIYDEQPERDNIANNNLVIGSLTLKTTYLLENSGVINIPEIKVKWFNTKTRKFEMATLPKQQLQVKASQLGNTTGQVDRPILPTSTPKLNKKQPSIHAPQSSTEVMLNRNTILFELLLLIGATLGWFLILQKRKRAPSPKVPIKKKQLYQQLKLACQTNDAKKANLALKNWAANYFEDPKIINLSQISSKVGHLGLAKAIQELNQFLYSPKTAENWSGEALWKAWIDYCNKKQTATNKHNQILSPMFPET